MGQVIYLGFYLSPFLHWVGFRSLKFSNFHFYLGILVIVGTGSLQSLHKAMKCFKINKVEFIKKFRTLMLLRELYDAIQALVVMSKEFYEWFLKISSSSLSFCQFSAPKY